MDDLAARLKAEARRAGFDLVGIAPAVAPPGLDRYRAWLDQGHAAGMDYLHRHRDPKAHPRHVLDGVRSVVMVGLVYGRTDPAPLGPTAGKVARYARGLDYHDVLWRKLDALLGWLRAECPGVVGRGVADTAPLLERDYARLAGLGWIGKNTCLIDRKAGSFTVLGALLVDVALRPDEPGDRGYCGTCTRCLDACPTGAFVAPGQLDARRCISYWTIEHKGPIPDLEAGALHDWAFGCDVCQDVCPWNRKAPAGRTAELEPRDGWSAPDLVAWLDADPDAFRRSLKGTALARTKRAGLLRNAAHVLGARRAAGAVPALIRRLADAEPVVRGAAAWALGKIGDAAAVPALLMAQDDPDPAARAAIRAALGELGIASGGDAG